MSLLIVGLGNPGSKYTETRHNIGFMALDSYADKKSLLWKEKFKGEYNSFSQKDEKVYLLKPMTFMNLSGESVQKASQFFKVEKESIIVVHDELDLPFGTLALKKGGGLAGHNGLKSIASLLGTKDSLRMRIGIGRPKHGDVSNFVLSKFNQDESIVLDRYIEGVVQAIDYICDKGFAKAATSYSKKSLIG